MKLRFIQTLVAGLLVSGPFAANAYDSCCYNPCDDACCDWYVYGDYLYWNACKSGLDYAISIDETPALPTLGKGQVHRLNDKWDSGFRVGLGYRCDESTDFGLRYTYFQACNKGTYEFANGAGATRIHPADTTYVSPNLLQATPDYRLKYNVLDIETGSWSAQGCDLKLRPFVAVRLSWVQQDMDVIYDTGTVASPGTQTAVNQKVDMDAYGVMMGADARYHLCDCFYLTSRISSGALYGDFSYDSVQILDPNVTPSDLLDVHGCDCRAVFSTEVSVGLEFFLCDMCGSDLIFSFGYELHTMFNMTDFQDFPSAAVASKVMRDDSSLMLHGLFVRLGASF